LWVLDALAATKSTTTVRNLRNLLGLINTSLSLTANGTYFAGQAIIHITLFIDQGA
jgi:hypothetical protein